MESLERSAELVTACGLGASDPQIRNPAINFRVETSIFNDSEMVLEPFGLIPRLLCTRKSIPASGHRTSTMEPGLSDGHAGLSEAFLHIDRVCRHAPDDLHR